LLLDGKYLSLKGKKLIIELAETMNNKRLSTYSNKSSICNLNLKAELELLEKSKPLIKMDSEGRAMVISEKKWIRTTLIIKANLPDGKIKYFPTGVSCAKFFSVSSTIITRRLNDKKSLICKENNVLAFSLNRIKVYTKI
jgi:hypothetical protein